MRWSIRYQLMLPLLILLLGVIAMSSWAAVASARHAGERIDSQVRQIAETLDKKSTFPLTSPVLNLIKDFSGADFLLLEENKPPVNTLPAMPNNLADPTTNQSIHLNQRIVVETTPYLYTAVRLHREPHIGATLYIFYPERLRKEAVWQAVRPSLYLGVLSGLGALVVTVLLAHRLTQRVRTLEHRTRLIASGDFSPMPLPKGNDELTDLTRSVNDMAEQLDKYQELTRKTERLRLLGQLSGGLAHQLRNGVTGARLAVQVHNRECHEHEEDESVQVALRQLALVEMHLKRFLDLGRAGELRKTLCHLVSLLEETLTLLRPQCKHSRIELGWQPAAEFEKITVLGDSGQLGHVFLNVITNAVEAAGPGGTVNVELSQPNPTHIDIAVVDSGTGPSPIIAEHLFEPFVTGKPEGVGIGLSVAKQVVEAHGGNIVWSRVDHHTRFLIRLPVENQVESDTDSG